MVDMASDLSADIVHILVKGLMILVLDTPANEANNTLLQKCSETLKWLQSQAQEVGIRSETSSLLSTLSEVLSERIIYANEQAEARADDQICEPGQIRPFNVVKLLEAWDRSLPGGSAAVIADLEEIIAAIDARRHHEHISKDE